MLLFLLGFQMNWTKQSSSITLKVVASVLDAIFLVSLTDRCEHPVEPYDLLQWQGLKELQIVPFPRNERCVWIPRAKMEKCNVSSSFGAHLVPRPKAVWGQTTPYEARTPSNSSFTFERLKRKSAVDQNRHFLSAKNSQTAQWGGETIFQLTKALRSPSTSSDLSVAETRV